SFETALPSTFIGNTALGCNIFKNSLLINLKRTKILIFLIPPAVEPAHPPTNIKENNISLLKVGHWSKSTVEYPVVVIIEPTWKYESLKAVPKLSYPIELYILKDINK